MNYATIPTPVSSVIDTDSAAAYAAADVSISEACAEDLADIQDLLFEIFQEPQFNIKEEGHTLWERMQARYQADPQKNVDDFWGPDKSRRYAVLLRQKQTKELVGVAWILASDQSNDVGELNKLYLRKDFRGRGLGKAVLTSMIEKAREIGFKTMYLITGRELTTAIALYKSFGFVEVPQERYFNSPNSIAMERHL